MTFAIIACDGLWKTFSNEEAVQYASAQFEAVAKEELPRQLGETQEHAKWRTVAERLAAEAVRRKCGDNVSVLLVKLSIV
ncbi:unnamed protein product [Caenorhabditis auriculariae]|uniref:PPM-type phosphatase domain-containing protein n=1 Tax=Caenorhabditis auriculariae TaxID=2777116 RepID=A0A8S1HTP0_9PELO|nr:unnamed protein product [Caenorhabditis auriculariae]